MAVRVQLNDGLQVVSRISLADMRKAYQKALDRNTVLDVKEPDGSVSAVNPIQILYFEEVDDATAERLMNGPNARRRQSTPA